MNTMSYLYSDNAGYRSVDWYLRYQLEEEEYVKSSMGSDKIIFVFLARKTISPLRKKKLQPRNFFFE